MLNSDSAATSRPSERARPATLLSFSPFRIQAVVRIPEFAWTTSSRPPRLGYTCPRDVAVRRFTTMCFTKTFTVVEGALDFYLGPKREHLVLYPGRSDSGNRAIADVRQTSAMHLL